MAKLLSTMSYSQVIQVFNQPTFNFAVLSYCFSFVKNMFTQVTLSSGRKKIFAESKVIFHYFFTIVIL